MLTGDHWGAAYRLGMIQQISPNPAQALDAGIGLAQKIAAWGPLGIKTTLESAHLSIDESEAAAFAKLDEHWALNRAAQTGLGPVRPLDVASARPGSRAAAREPPASR